MRKIRVKDIKDGMVLEEPLTSSVGVILMGQGTVLRESFAARLAQRGIITVCVEGEPEPEDMIEEHNFDNQKLHLRELFDGKLINEPMKIIYEALVRHRNANGA